MDTSILGKASGGLDLSGEEMSRAIDEIMRGEWADAQIGLLLTALHDKGLAAAELAGAADALRRHMTPIRSRRENILDTCGTGGDGSGTFNISTAAALVAAAAGVAVAKHGNRKITSRSGSADVLVELGVNVEAPLARVEACLDELGICFCFAPLWHASMKQVAAVRRQLPFPTIFNLLGPLANPAGARYQLLGVGRREIRPLMAEALVRLGTTRSLVVSGDDGLDELTIAAPSRVSEAAAGSVREFEWTPEDFGLARGSLDELRAAGPAESAAMIRGVLDRRPGSARDIVVLNAAAAIWLAGRAASLVDAAGAASEAIDSGAARGLLARLAEFTQQS